jgi:hypothetical protein
MEPTRDSRKASLALATFACENASGNGTLKRVNNITGGFYIDCRGRATEKVPQFILPLKSIYSKNFGFNEQKCIFETI